MTDKQEEALLQQEEATPREAAPAFVDNRGAVEERPVAAPPATAEAEVVPAAPNGDAQRRHAEAGRKGARRVHQLIQEGKQYEQEHGLKRGRQRLRQLIELGKLYEQEHGLRPRQPKRRGERLSRVRREELLATLLERLLRIVKPSFRAELARLVEALPKEEKGHAA